MLKNDKFNSNSLPVLRSFYIFFVSFKNALSLKICKSNPALRFSSLELLLWAGSNLLINNQLFNQYSFGRCNFNQVGSLLKRREVNGSI